MTASKSTYTAGQEVLAKFLTLMLNYQCGLTITVTQELEKASVLLLKEGKAAHCVFVIQNSPVSNERTLDALSH